ncbi:4-amino-4-deoxychorismate lyase [Prevotella herbatica]|uniref:4-amino-4-deoxychorismate lyase n=1 Tax=Prevotella herbatica TaxID=2801997 RepID=A0ABN6EEE6_9BACT|nr:aminotransferase class IV [Prevotella herbatica]BCS84294.1 4-amino-4-deoxychorismate lyase [Prevotella herbatica]
MINGCAYNIGYHNDRLNNTRHHFWQSKEDINLLNYITPQESNDIIKVRVVYGENGIEDISYSEYSMRNIKTLKIVTDNHIEYSFKSTDRSAINKLVEKKGLYDEIIISKNSLIRDTSFTNIALFDGNTWYTPKHPLLRGTKRAHLINNNIVKEKDIHENDIFKYKAIRLFNAMIDFGDIEIPINKDTLSL